MNAMTHPAVKRNEAVRSSKRVLDPMDRVSEVLFGLIMVLTFTGSLSVATAGHAEVREMLIGALGCNLAWGIIDGLLYLMACLAEKGRSLHAWDALRKAATVAEGQRLIAQALPPVIASVVEPAQLEAMRARLVQLPEPPDRPRLEAEDWRGFLGVVLLVFVSTLPVVIPFILMRNAYSALRLSNLIAVTMLFLCGYATGRLTRYHPWGMGVGMVLLGSLLVAMTMALGG
jgi:VIT family protein